MKRLILLILPIILVAQIPLHMDKLVPSDWKQTFDFGVKWTSLLVNSFSAVANNNEKQKEFIPEGVVTTTVAMAVLPDTADLLQIDREVSLAQCQIEQAKEAIKLQKELKNLHLMEIRIKRI
jgi:hypothetical protein